MKEDRFVTTPTMVITNTRKESADVIVKTGKQKRRERRKLNRKKKI